MKTLEERIAALARSIDELSRSPRSDRALSALLRVMAEDLLVDLKERLAEEKGALR